MLKFVCVSCKKELSNVWENDQDYIQPSGGVVFEGSATYGSSYDTAEGTMFIVVCDNCLKTMLATPNGVHVQRVVQPAVKEIVSITEEDLTFL